MRTAALQYHDSRARYFGTDAACLRLTYRRKEASFIMRPVQIITDSCSDLPQELLSRYGIAYAQMRTVYQGKETPASLSWDYYTPTDFYKLMRDGERITTTQVPVEEFRRAFSSYLERGMDLVYVACSSKQSGSVGTAAVLAKELKAAYPDAAIYCLDSLNASIGEGILAIEAAKLRDEGFSAKEIYERLLPLRNRVNEYVAVHSLDALRRAGRVTASASFFGNLMGVKPILISDAEGVQTPIKKVKGRRNSLAELVRLLKESIERPEEQTVYLVHADCSAEEVEAVRTMVRESIPCKEIVTAYIGPIIGASIGPDAIGLFAFGKEVTYTVAARA